MNLRAASASSVQAQVDDLTPQVQNASPVSGDTVQMNNTRRVNTLWLTPAAALATLTVTLPNDASTGLGQIVFIACAKNVTSLTINGSANILNTATSLLANELISFQKVDIDTWIRK